MRYHIVICDDEEVFIKEVEDNIHTFGKGRQLEIKVEKFFNGEKLLEYIKENPADIIFLDIEMPPGITGIETAKKIRGFNTEVAIIICTAHDQYALAAYQVDAMQYLLKPYEYPAFEKILSKAILSANTIQEVMYRQEALLKVKENEWQPGRSIPISSIHYIEKLEGTNRMEIYSDTGEYFLYGSLDKLMEQKSLHNKEFVKINRSCIVNLEKVYTIRKAEKISSSKRKTKSTVIMKDGKQLELDRNKYRKVYEAFYHMNFKNTV